MAYSAKSIANGFLTLSRREGKSLSNMKLQKLLYFAHAMYLATTGCPLISDESAEAWQYGPVYPSVYHEFKLSGSNPISGWAYQQIPGTYQRGPAPLPDSNTMAFLEQVWRTYGHQSAIDLSAMSHVNDGPWARVRRERPGSMGADIPDQYIKEYYGPAVAQARAS